MEPNSNPADTAQEPGSSGQSVAHPECSSCSESGNEPTVREDTIAARDRRTKNEKIARGLTHLESWKRQRHEEIEPEESVAGATSCTGESEINSLGGAKFDFVTAFHCIANNPESEGGTPSFGKAELRKVLNAFKLHPTEDDLNKLFEEWMGEPDKGLSEEVYVQWMMESVRKSGIGLDAMEQVFHVFDVDNSGALGMSELKQALAALGEEVPDDLVSGVLKSVGDSSRERLTQTDFYKYINHFANSPLGTQSTEYPSDYDTDDDRQ
mmetsp:Transcript_38902/g.84677  ORF Transcript_38902/g.84677 Transcript_38902/m.84677 type:complete len:267 (+) Transcript_38902:292-1092(+)|eukprot:CAMPEP_0118926290 /NCGR_PEP_ID=MMETSP1169-20130426/4016_1 /TAXON_ID=36882 /ORGANISM="Pyramimonas obovata, Strain CCMP722" /LENGTH=266 /DNA_ID=CAMNT_0006867809 /DNA_START=227 /DNA_END=1027 /DNA_ORIENTATION=-